MTNKFEKLIIDTNAKLIISKDIYNIIQKLHLKYPGVEWSGLFSWSITSGGFNTMEEINQLVIKVDGIYPLSVGSSGSVYYKLDSEVLQCFIKNNINPLDKKFGTIHTHHSMGAFFSDVDQEDLFDSSKGYINYLSLVVDTKNTYKAAISKNISQASKEYKISFKNSLNDSSRDTTIKITSNIKEALLMLNLKVVIEDLEYPEYLDSFMENITNVAVTTNYPNPQQYTYKDKYSFKSFKDDDYDETSDPTTSDYDIIAREIYCEVLNIKFFSHDNNVNYSNINIPYKYITNSSYTITKEKIHKLLKKYKLNIPTAKEHFKNSTGTIGTEIYKVMTKK